MSQFFKFHCGLKGRINRLAFFIWMAIYYGIATIFVLILEFVGFTEESLNHIGGIIILVIFVPVYLLWGWMIIANTVKRLHDVSYPALKEAACYNCLPPGSYKVLRFFLFQEFRGC